MAEQALKINISVDGKTDELKTARNELNALSGASDKTSEAVTRLSVV